MRNNRQLVEKAIHGIFLALGLVTVGCVLLITVYLVASGIPAIRQIGLVPFLMGGAWESTAAQSSYGILTFIFTSVTAQPGPSYLAFPWDFLRRFIWQRWLRPR